MTKDAEIDDVMNRARQVKPLSWNTPDLSAQATIVPDSIRLADKLAIDVLVARSLRPEMVSAIVADALKQAASRLAYELQPRVLAEVDKILLNGEWVESIIGPAITAAASEFADDILRRGHK